MKIQLQVMGSMMLSLFLVTPVTLRADSTTTPPPPQGTPSGQGAGQGNSACKADVQKLCGNVQPGGGRIMACLKQNQAQVSPACQQTIQQMMAKHRGEGQGACKADVQKLCAGTQPGHGAIMQCLQQNQSKLSPECAQALTHMKQKGQGQAQGNSGAGQKGDQGGQGGNEDQGDDGSGQ